MLKIVVVGATMLMVVVIAVVSLVVSTSKGTDWSETVWKSMDKTSDKEPPNNKTKAKENPKTTDQ